MKQLLRKLFNNPPEGRVFQLMVYVAGCEGLAISTTFGGVPVANDAEEFAWPTCAHCNGNMQYLGKILDQKHLTLLFMCQNDPGMCSEWEPNSGGNQAIRFAPTELIQIPPPENGAVLRNTEYGCEIVDCRGQNYHEAVTSWVDQSGQSPRRVLGQLSGEPDWLQADETPNCGRCDTQMRFVAHLEPGPDYQTEMNFGGGCAYLFACDSCVEAKFLWQC